MFDVVCQNNLIDFSLDISVTKSLLLMILADGQIPFLLHLESYLLYKEGHQVGHCHQLCYWFIFLLSVP